MTDKKRNYDNMPEWRAEICKEMEKDLGRLEGELRGASGKQAEYLKSQIRERDYEIDYEFNQHEHPPVNVYRLTEFGHSFSPRMFFSTNKDVDLDKEIRASGAMTIYNYLMGPRCNGKGALRWEIQKDKGVSAWYIDKGLRYLMENKKHINRMRRLMKEKNLDFKKNEDVPNGAGLVESRSFGNLYADDLKYRDRDAYGLLIDSFKYYGEAKLTSPCVQGIAKPTDLPRLKPGEDIVIEITPAKVKAIQDEAGDVTIVLASRPSKAKDAKNGYKTFMELRYGKRGSEVEEIDIEEAEELLKKAGDQYVSERLERAKRRHKAMGL